MAKPSYESIRVIASAEGTTVLDANRRAIPNIFGINMALRPNKPPVMQINLIAGAFDVDGKPMFMAADPAGGPPKPVKKIEFWDGTGLEFPEPPPVNVAMQPPASANTGVVEVVRQLIDVTVGEEPRPQPIDLPPPPDGKRWETDDELRVRALASQPTAAKVVELPQRAKANGSAQGEPGDEPAAQAD